jgi:hypothetical protein
MDRASESQLSRSDRKGFRRKAQLVFILVLLFSADSFSQIVNIEKKRRDVKGFQATAVFDFNIKETGNRIVEFKNLIDVQYAFKKHALIFINDIRLLGIDKGSLINNGFQHLRYNYTIKDTSFLTLEAFSQFQYNEQKLLEKRILSGLGPRLRVVKKPSITWYIAPLSMFEYEQLNDSLHTETKRIRLDAYTNLNLTLNKNISYNLIVYWQPDYANFNDYRLSGETGLRLNLSKYFAYEVGFSADYDNLPPANVQNTFWSFNNRLVINIK